MVLHTSWELWDCSVSQWWLYGWGNELLISKLSLQSPLPPSYHCWTSDQGLNTQVGQKWLIVYICLKSLWILVFAKYWKRIKTLRSIKRFRAPNTFNLKDLEVEYHAMTKFYYFRYFLSVQHDGVLAWKPSNLNKVKILLHENDKER